MFFVVVVFGCCIVVDTNRKFDVELWVGDGAESSPSCPVEEILPNPNCAIIQTPLWDLEPV